MTHPVARQVADSRSRLERIEDGAVNGLGSTRFIVAQTVIVMCWIGLNITGLVRHWDPYPFILLNLAFSTQAAYAAPLILLAQRRQDEKRDAIAAHDHQMLACLHRSPATGDCSCATERNSDG